MNRLKDRPGEFPLGRFLLCENIDELNAKINNKYMIGMGNETFAPEGVVTRAQFVQILYNIEGKPPVTPNSQFVDVLPDPLYDYRSN